MKRITSVLAVSTLCLLTGCASLVSATREEPIQEDHGSRTLGSYIEDEVIENKVLVNISKGSQALSQSHVSVTSYNGQVLLTGQVPDEASRREAEMVTREVRKVRKIHNELQITGPTSALVRTSDVYITSRVKVQLLADKSVSGGRIKVVTENGTVYLMGLVTQQEANAAVNIVRSIGGVQKIVKVFEYI